MQYAAILEAFQKARPHLEALCPDASKDFFSLVEEKCSSSRPAITVYGIYSHGKSSLINALLGKDAAEVSEEPKTDRVQDYEWRGYTITDTPGIDAPIEHEQIAEERLYRSEVVLFVIDSSSTELYLAQEKLVRMVKNGQYVCLIINDRDNCLSEAEKLVRIKDNFEKKLQEAANEQDVVDILERIPIFFVNAKSALKAKKEQKNNLLKNSGISDLEQNLDLFFKKFPSGQKWQRLQREFFNLIELCKIASADKTNDPHLKEAQKSLHRIEQTEKDIHEDIEDELNKRLVPLKSQLRSGLDIVQTQDVAQRVLLPIMQDFGNSMSEYCKTRLEEVAKQVEDICLSYDSFSQTLAATASEQAGDSVNSRISDFAQSLPWKDLLSTMKWEELVNAGIVETLKFGKALLPSLFKGVGIKTMEKWALLASKWFGPIVTTLGIIYDFYQINKEEREAQEAAQRKARQLDEAVSSIAENVRTEFLQQINNIISCIFVPLKEKIQGEVNKLVAAHEGAQRSLEMLTKIQESVAAFFAKE